MAKRSDEFEFTLGMLSLAGAWQSPVIRMLRNHAFTLLDESTYERGDKHPTDGEYGYIMWPDGSECKIDGDDGQFYCQVHYHRENAFDTLRMLLNDYDGALLDETWPPKPVRVLVVVEGGTVTGAWASVPDVAVDVRDFDNIANGYTDPVGMYADLDGGGLSPEAWKAAGYPFDCPSIL